MVTIVLSGKHKGGGSGSLHTQGELRKKGASLTYKIQAKTKYRRWTASDLDDATANMVWACRFGEIDPTCDAIELPFTVPWTNLISTATVRFSKGAAAIQFNFVRNFENWANPYSIKEYADAIQAAAAESDGQFTFVPIDPKKFTEGFRLRCPARAMDHKIRDEVSYWDEKIKVFCANVTEQLMRNVRRDSLVTFFDFPAPIRSTCQQYLIYFVQFLEDLGIEADSEIKEDAGRVLFSITPREGPEALQKIKDALEIYLELPRNPGFDTASSALRDVAVAQLRANVLHLQSQLMLAQATIQANNAAIDALDLTVYQQRQLLSERGQRDKVPDNGEEPILGDTVLVTTYEGKGFKVDLPRILRKLKRTFRRERSTPANPRALPPPSKDE